MASYRTILCPTDLSPAGDAAVALAYRLVDDGGTVHLLHVSEPGFIVLPFDIAPVMVAHATPEAMAEHERKVAEHLKTLVPAPARGVTTKTHVVGDVGPSALIQKAAKEAGADVIVMGTHGRSGFGKLMLGSVASDVLHHATIPVILVKAPKPKK